MWAWIRRCFTTDTQSATTDLRKHNLQLQKLLADSLKDAQAQNRKLIECLDRVVVSRFDPPLKPQPMEQPQSFPFPDLSDVLSVEDDKAFLEATSGRD